MKVLLISANTEQFNMAVIPLGLACVSAAVEKAGHDVTLLDLMFETNAGAIIKKAITKFHPEYIGIWLETLMIRILKLPYFCLTK